MAVFEVYRTARTAKDCENYPSCSRGIQPGERYLLATASPWDMEVNQSDRWLTLTVCREHMRPEPPPEQVAEQVAGKVPDEAHPGA